MCVYIRMYVCIYVYVYICTYAYICVFILPQASSLQLDGQCNVFRPPAVGFWLFNEIARATVAPSSSLFEIPVFFFCLFFLTNDLIPHIFTTFSSCDSVESFPVHRNNNQAAERDWDNGSTASSIASLAEYTGESKDPVQACNYYGLIIKPVFIQIVIL